MIWRDRVHTYADLARSCDDWVARLTAAGVTAGMSVAVTGDFSPASVAALVALARLKQLLPPR